MGERVGGSGRMRVVTLSRITHKHTASRMYDIVAPPLPMRPPAWLPLTIHLTSVSSAEGSAGVIPPTRAASVLWSPTPEDFTAVSSLVADGTASTTSPGSALPDTCFLAGGATSAPSARHRGYIQTHEYHNQKDTYSNSVDFHVGVDPEYNSTT